MENPRDETTAHELACARVASRFPRGWLRSYVKSKLRRDPIFPAAYELLHGSKGPILDVGCGVGLLAFYLRERGCTRIFVEGGGVTVSAFLEANLLDRLQMAIAPFIM